MPDLSVDCPVCGRRNDLPVDSTGDDFTCAGCGESSPVDAAALGGGRAAPDYLVGEVVSECKVMEKVGEGGFGSVYRALDQNLQRIVALKVMLPSLTTNVEFVQKFIREAVTAAQLNHPNIVAIHKVGRDERRGLHYLIMEFVEGETLADVVQARGILRVEDALPLVLQACDALATAHEHSIVHRDIKPENLMVTKAGVVKITDFGLAKSLATDSKTTKVMGTPHYMSPEQFEGKPVDGRSDIYSLGVTFYFLLSKTRPYEGQNTVQIIYSILTQQPKSLPELNKEVPEEIWIVIQRMIAKKPEDRYQTLRDTITDLRRFQERNYQDKQSCPACSAKNPKGRKFCRGCGAPLLVACPACGSQEPAGAALCSGCGADLARLVRVKKALDAAKRFQQLGDLRRSAESYRQALELDPGNAEAELELNRLGGTIDEVDRVRTEALDLQRTGQMEQALDKLEDLLRRYPMATEVKEHRDELRQALADRKVNHLLETAEAHASEGRIREALEGLDHALRVAPNREDVRAKRSELGQRVAAVTEQRQRAAQALASGRYEDAFALATEVLKVMPGDSAMEEVRRKSKSSVESVDAFVARGRAHLDGRRLSDALSEFEAALSLRPGDAQLFQLVEETRGRIHETREKMALCRRLLADRNFEEARSGLEALLEAHPEDAEVKSLLQSCDRGLEESRRARAVQEALREGERLEQRGELAAALEQYARILELDSFHEDARARREHVEARAREERDVRELATEHLQDGRFDEGVETLERLKRVNPPRAQAIDREIVEARQREQQVAGSLKRAEESLDRREYRRAMEAADVVLAVAPRHPRAVAIRKDAEKAVAAIDRFLAECDRLLVSEMFDEALEALDKARGRGASQEEYRPRRAAAEQGRLALLKTDATRSILAKDYEAAIAAYEQVLEVQGDDRDALQGKRSAERRIRILTTEPLALRLGAAAIVVLLLGLVQFTAVASTDEASAIAVAELNRQMVEASVTREVNERKREPELTAALAAEREGDFVLALEAWERESREFPDDERVQAGRGYASAMLAAKGVPSPRERLDLLHAAEERVGELPDVRRERQSQIRERKGEAVREMIADARALERTGSALEAQSAYNEILTHPVARDFPESEELRRDVSYLERLETAEKLREQARFQLSAEQYELALAEARTDERRGRVTQSLADLRGEWIGALAERADAAEAAGPDEQAWYQVITELEAVVRTFDLPREQVLAEFRARR